MQITVILPDGAQKSLPEGSNAVDLATAISPGLAKTIVATKVNGEVKDVRDVLPDGAKVELLKVESPEGLDTLRHSCEHVLAAAVCRLFPGAQVTMGPKTHGGEFYYDFDIGRAFTPEDLIAIEKEMQKLIEQKIEFSKSIVSKQEATDLFKKLGQRYKPEILEWIPDNNVSIYQSADFIDLCRGPHLPHAGFIKSFKLLSNSGCYWRADSNREMLQRISGIAFASKKELEDYLYRIEEAKKRDHRKLGPQLELFFVSERFDSHEYPESSDVELLTTGTVNPLKQGADALTCVDEELIAKLQRIFAPKNVKVSSYSVSSSASEPAWNIELKLFSSPISKEQKQQLSDLEKDLNKRHAGGKIAVVVESKFTEEIGPGLVSWLPKGGRLRSTIEDISRKMHFEGGYDIVYSPHIAKSDLWKVSGHWFFYKESMFSPMCIDGQEYVAKPMNCPFHVLMFKNKLRSYRDLPFRFAEFGTVYRYELAGVMHGLMRVRGFTQDDAHLFCRWDQINDEIDKVIGFILKLLRLFGFNNFEVNLSTRPEKYVGDLDEWHKAEVALEEAVKRHGLPYKVDEGGGAFYGPKIDIKLRDSLDRMWQCSTVQLDFNNPERFGLSFINAEGKPERPVMLHRALFGSLERFIGILIEEYVGAFPMWLAPEQIRVLAIADRHLDYALELGEKLKKAGLRVHVPTTSDKLGAKIREAQLAKVPMMLVVGDQEVENQGATVRLRSGEDAGFMNQELLVAYCMNGAQVPIDK